MSDTEYSFRNLRKADTPVSDETKEQRFAAAQAEWEAECQKVEEGTSDAFKLAMWLQKNEYSLRDLPAAHARWRELEMDTRPTMEIPHL